MNHELPLLNDTPRESMLTYAVLFGRQQRRNDPFALGAQLTDLAVRGGLTISETDYNSPNLTLRFKPGLKMFKEEEVFTDILRQHCLSDEDGYISLGTALASKPLAGQMRTLWERVVMMHHEDHNKDRPLYNADPTRLVKWERFRRTLGWILAVGSVYAEPGFMGRVEGLDQVQKGYAKSEFLGNTSAGRMLRNRVGNLRKQMLQLAKSGQPDSKNIADYERALPYAFLFDDELKDAWPAFLSRCYPHQQYPSWLKPVHVVEDTSGRQQHIAGMLRVMGLLCFPVHKRRAVRP